MKWNNRSYRPGNYAITQQKKVVDISELLKPYDGSNKGGVWIPVQQVVANVYKEPEQPIPVTPTPTSSLTPTPTSSDTPTPTPTTTLTSTPTPTPTTTLTSTPTPTTTLTSTPTPTPTQPLYSAATAFISAVEGGGDTLTNTEKSAINQLVGDLTNYSLINVFDAFYPFVGGTSSSTKWNLLNPVDTDLGFRITWYGGMTFSSSGVLGNSTNSGGNSYVNPSSYTGMCMGVYINQGLTPTPTEDYDMGGYDFVLADYMISLGYNSKTTRFVNFAGTSYITTTNGSYSNSLLIGQSSGGTTQLIQNTTELVSGSETFQQTNQSCGIGCSWRGSPVEPSGRGYSVAFIGGNALNPTQISNLNTTINNFNTALGR